MLVYKYIYTCLHTDALTHLCVHAIEFHVRQHKKLCWNYAHLIPVKNAHFFHSESKLHEENSKNLSTHLCSPCELGCYTGRYLGKNMKCEITALIHQKRSILIGYRWKISTWQSVSHFHVSAWLLGCLILFSVGKVIWHEST